jgi:hypothetical protein
MLTASLVLFVVSLALAASGVWLLVRPPNSKWAETGGRLLRYASIAGVADRMGIEQEEAEALAAELDDAGLVRVGSWHSVTLEEAGRQLAVIGRLLELRNQMKPAPI